MKNTIHSKWKVGDRIATKRDYLRTATILDVIQPNTNMVPLYTIKWDHFDGHFGYFEDSVIDLWEDAKNNSVDLKITLEHTPESIERDLSKLIADSDTKTIKENLIELNKLIDTLESKIGADPYESYYNGLSLDYDDIAADSLIDLSSIDSLVPNSPKRELKKAGCDHQWVNYVGLIESYDYCKLCNKKRE